MHHSTANAPLVGITDRGEPSSLAPLKRNLFWHGKEMGVEAFQWEQDYHRQLVATLTRLALGCGVLCGLTVNRAGSGGLTINRGAGIDGAGRLIIVDRAVTLDDLSRWLCPSPDQDDSATPLPGRYQLCLLYHECPVAPTPVLTTGCDTRLECRPSAVIERFRFEARPIERPRCEPLCPPGHDPGGTTPCESGCDDCVALAWFEWDGQTITEFSTADRAEIGPPTQPGRNRSGPDELGSPRLVHLWPEPGTILSRAGSPSPWGRWRYRPRLELGFDRPIDLDRVDDPGDWLRAWMMINTARSDDEVAVVVEPLDLRYRAEATTMADGGHRLTYEFDAEPPGPEAARFMATRGFAIVVQARAGERTGPASATLARPAQLHYAGTGLSAEELDRLWHNDTLPDGTGLDSLQADRVPACVGDGYEGGTLSFAFGIESVGEEERVTGLSPHNGARRRSATVPTVEISATADPRPLQLRAWLVPDDGRPIGLTVRAGVGLPSGEQADVFDRFASSLDPTLNQELSRTARFTINPTEDARSGRVLLIAPATTTAGDYLGGFDGTCLSEDEVASIYEDGLSPDLLHHIRPSGNAMPRAAQGGNWIHWTFAWEQDNVTIS